jgi:indole-3-glycerol phosphate synthase
MVALIEVHTLEELDRILTLDGVQLIGINNRNLQDFSVDLQTTCTLLSTRCKQLQAQNLLVVSESGLHTPADLQVVAAAGAQAVLIGEALIKQSDPGVALAQLLCR